VVGMVAGDVLLGPSVAGHVDVVPGIRVEFDLSIGPTRCSCSPSVLIDASSVLPADAVVNK
jgi:hypothetical protein